MIFAVRSQCTHPVNQITRLFSTPDCRSQKPIHSVCGTLGIHFGIHFEFFVFLFSLAAEGGLCGPVRFEQRLSPLSPLFISLFSFIHIHSANTATLYTGKRSREEAQNLFPKTARLAAKSLRGPKSTPFRSADTPACEGGRIGRPTHTHLKFRVPINNISRCV